MRCAVVLLRVAQRLSLVYPLLLNDFQVLVHNSLIVMASCSRQKISLAASLACEPPWKKRVLAPLGPGLVGFLGAPSPPPPGVGWAVGPPDLSVAAPLNSSRGPRDCRSSPQLKRRLQPPHAVSPHSLNSGLNTFPVAPNSKRARGAADPPLGGEVILNQVHFHPSESAPDDVKGAKVRLPHFSPEGSPNHKRARRSLPRVNGKRVFKKPGAQAPASPQPSSASATFAAALKRPSPVPPSPCQPLAPSSCALCCVEALPCIEPSCLCTSTNGEKEV